ncbi:hypothetical protein Ferp_0403 [Ferroglobus placidus DSM 10642]|uniref:Ribbon-helix-helix protein CopG domain-containing protein n=1 Tax=Ferroglobus placidus (strain DSM 10642 / AEDII12DO) TaxID=589924 RepID=D3S2Q0_FERPA|nr:ribbon-helix-helix protein, CopG family [Ferroglobus placidus]ADC64580.1 hypothetical protein Ferp_0403 [Ferroglobus placidus DSM 10642]
MRKYYKRVTVALEENEWEDVKELSDMLGKSLSKIIREAVQIYSQIVRRSILNSSSLHEFDKLDLERLYNWIPAMADNQHIIIDNEHWRLLFEAIERIEDQTILNKFYEKVRNSGVAHGFEFFYEGYNTPLKILKRLEFGGWGYVLKKDDETYVFVIKSGIGSKFVEYFLRGVFESQNISAAITRGEGKLIIKILSK